jgi:beta-lactamase superfamily II metal-dependent hydrolase
VGLVLALVSCASALPVNRSLQAQSALTVPSLTVFIVDVGQGDATVIVGPGAEQERRVLVVDGGPLNKPDGGAVVKHLLDAQGIGHVDYAVVTHFDADHVGGFVTTENSTSLFWTKDCVPTPFFPRLATYEHSTDNFITQPAREWDRCTRAVQNRVRVTQGSGLGDLLDLGGGYCAKIVAGNGYVLDRATRVAHVNNSENARSVVVLVSGPEGFDFLLPGDVSGQQSGDERAEVEVAIADYLQTNNVDLEVLRVGHHGSANTSNPKFIQATKPEVAIISVGDVQPTNYKHPRCKTYQTLAAQHVQYVLQTETGKTDCKEPEPPPMVAHGTIRIDVTGGKYRITSVATESKISLTCTAMGCATDASTVAVSQTPRTCCQFCRSGKPCGDACIATKATCSKPNGCACAAQ